MNNYSEKVLEFARKAHAGQKRKFTGEDYINHPIAVAKIAERRLWEYLNKMSDNNLSIYEEDILRNNVEMIKSISYLHDTVEDTNVNIQDISNLLFELGVDADTRGTICGSVLDLTKCDINFDIIDYLKNIKQNYLARIVKLSDLEHNMSDLKSGNLLDKYKLCVYYLEN